MNKAVLVIVFLFLLTGCAKEQDLTQKKSPVAPAQEVKQMEPAQPIPAPKETEIVKKEAVEESGAQVAPPVAIVQEMQAKINKANVPVKPSEAAEKIIAENRWGFSVYDPQTKIEAFYTSSGTLLGSKNR